MPIASPTRRSHGWQTGTTDIRRLLGMILTLVIMLAGCGGEEQASPEDAGQPPDEPVTIRLGHWIAGQEILYVMEHLPEVAPNQGIWYEVEMTPFGAPAAIPQGIAAGTLDGGAVVAMNMATALEQGADIVITGCFVEDREGWGSVTWLARNDSDINAPADLRGQTIGTPGAGSSLSFIQEYWLREQGGLEPDADYQQTEVPFPQMAGALAEGHIAAGPLPPPFLQQALATGEYRPLFSLTDIRPRLVSVLFGLSREFIDENPVAAEKLMEDWVTVAGWIADPANREQVLEANNQTTEIPVEVLDQYLMTEEDGYRPPNGALDVAALQETWDFYREQGAFTTPLQVSDHVLSDLLPTPADEEAPE